ncbi:hypothetical protein GR160_10925 [Flavobacterium sp. Sd200]|uniref:hypothetical protein n=1 Tax=Flavobacterium sp. Sd200 TaxID=2692211 RepID=UPI00136CA3F6|nr:hypothetical protein [Flavobacterium sp. Sd200]MXN91740.1 hypothetical protein [Flavobacterium sp. Sd200]
MGFWKKKEEETAPSPVARWLACKITDLKEWWVKLMVKLTAKLSLSQQKMGFAILGLLCCFYCTFLIVQGFTTVKSGQKTIPVNSISRPESPKAVTSGDEHGEQEIRRIKHLFYVMDSLKHDPHGRRQYDSIAAYRPGLLDTLKKLEEYYKN